MNQITLTGNLGKDPELRTVGDTQLTTFSVASSETYTKNGEKVTKTEWHTVKAWGRTAEVIAQYFKKGSKILLTGKLEYEKWETDGKKNERAVIVLRTFEFIGGNNNGSDTSRIKVEGRVMTFPSRF